MTSGRVLPVISSGLSQNRLKAGLSRIKADRFSNPQIIHDMERRSLRSSLAICDCNAASS
jgi:hypothetical protein